MTRIVPNAPASRPSPKLRAVRGGRELCQISVHLEIVTPILGGGPRTREIDEVDTIRTPTVRGHLRFWWRALHAAKYNSKKELYEREGELWGCAAKDSGGRSLVEIRIKVGHSGNKDTSNPEQTASDAYALWPARAEKKTSTPAAPRRQPGTQFEITLKVPADYEAEIKNALRAWILFGGYGGRTRRGLGSFKVTKNTEEWLPAKPTREAIQQLFESDIFAKPMQSPGDTPWLDGASLYIGTMRRGEEREAVKAWTTALHWLRDFRQGTTGQQGNRAREPDPSGKAQRPSISNWPEADKIRQLTGKTKAHTPRHNAVPAWPRAGFGLPIIGQFQKQKRDGGHYEEPDSFELCWRANNVEYNRLASPLIVKALPLANGTFVPCTLWLNRAYPNNGQVYDVKGKASSGAPFDRLVAPGDTACFSALAGKPSLRQAFLDWLLTKNTTVVIP